MVALSSALSTAATGMAAAARRTASIALTVASPGGLDSLPQSVVDLDLSITEFTADAMVFKTADRMTGTLLDMLDTDRPGPRR
jgi:hypothetical protein